MNDCSLGKLSAERRKSFGFDCEETINGQHILLYTMGVVLRERQRIAAIFESNGMIAMAGYIRDSSQDNQVFKWTTPDTPIDPKK
jgi:hypothetical protein